MTFFFSVTAYKTAWAMPSRWTFEIPPIAEFIERHMPPLTPNGVVVDPFAGRSKRGTHRNDIAIGGVDAEEFCNRLLAEGVQADVVLFDPPYSPRQISECYKSVGLRASAKDTQNAALYARVRKPLADLLKPGGVALSFGWQSSGFGKGWPTTEILLVQHGGAHNDTICVAQRKPHRCATCNDTGRVRREVVLGGYVEHGCPDCESQLPNNQS